ncbi:uncharacterized protein LOC144742682 [Ciona intestinalis]
MSTGEGLYKLNSAFNPFVPPNNNVCNLITNPTCTNFNCFRGTDSTSLWFAPTASGTAPVPLEVAAMSDPNGFNYNGDGFRGASVGKFVTVANDDSSRNEFNIGSQAAFHQTTYAECLKSLNQVVTSSQAGGLQMQAPTMPLLTSQPPTSENVARRQAYYHQRHHPDPSSVCKNRFSATGATVDCTVIRDSKMSLSSAPPSPSAGSAGGSLGSNLSRLNPITQAQCYGIVHPRGAYFSAAKKASDMSTSSTLSSYSSSSLSSTPSLTGVSPRKRRADEKNCSHNGCQVGSCHFCSTSDVTAGVDCVRLCDRPSNGSVSPVDQLARRDHWPDDQHRLKRSKNDNEEDDDVVFVSMETAPTLPKQRLCETVFQNPFAVAPQKQTSKPRRSKKTPTTKRASRPSPSTSASPVNFAIPASFPPSTYQLQQPMFVAPPSYANTKPSYYNVSEVQGSKGYFLRSTVSGRGGKKMVDENNNLHVASTSYSRDQHQSGVRYHTRSQQKRKDLASTPHVVNHHPQQEMTYTQQPSVPNPRPAPLPVQSQPQTAVPSTPISQGATGGIPDGQQRSSAAFKKIYDIRGIIGVGGGGTVYAGTRKADNVQVAIKQVPKAKVKRWGKLDGRVVPIEFELLHRAAFSGNRGVIAMMDWYERRNSYILVMERPQPVIDLFDYLNQHGALPEKVAKNIFKQIVEAVLHCHANGVVHRDIKDENVLLNLHTSEAKLIDFGCGTMLKETAYTEFAGTPEFYPPEWFIERRYMGRKVDAWSLGVLLYTMIEAEVPFQKEKDIIACELRHKRAQQTTTKACRHLIALMLQKDQNKRPSLDEILHHPWLTSSEQPPKSISNGVMSTRDLYVAPIPATPTGPPSNMRGTQAHHQSPVFTPQTSQAYHAHPIPGSPASVPPTECAVRS